MFEDLAEFAKELIEITEFIVLRIINNSPESFYQCGCDSKDAGTFPGVTTPSK
jgi:hypothetical protein